MATCTSKHVVVDPPKTYVLELSEDEAHYVAGVLGHCNQDAVMGRYEHGAPVYKAIQAAIGGHGKYRDASHSYLQKRFRSPSPPAPSWSKYF